MRRKGANTAKVTRKRSRVTPFLWYDGQAEEAARCYVDIFRKGSRVTRVSPLSVTFELEGQPFIALNGGPMFKFSEALSLFVECRDQEEVDYFWRRLGEGGKPGRCGWLKDRWGLSWQIIPRALGECLDGPDRDGAKRAMEAMLGMGKLVVKQLRAAYRGNAAERTLRSGPRRGKAERNQRLAGSATKPSAADRSPKPRRSQ